MEQSAEYYDQIFNSEKGFQTHYKDSFYFVHWTQVIQYLKKINSPVILEVGCGPGQLANYLDDEEYGNYAGFDFSQTAIEKAKQILPQVNFWVGDALQLENFEKYDYNSVICLEVLEHINDDIKILNNIKPGANIIFSVPNFDAESHVRWFTNERQIKSRYYKKIAIEDIVRIGNIYICKGVRSDFTPNLFQAFLKSREEVNLNSFIIRLRHRLKNILK